MAETPYLTMIEEVKEAVQRLAIDRGYMLGPVAIVFADGSAHQSWIGQPRDGEMTATLVFGKNPELLFEPALNDICD